MIMNCDQSQALGGARPGANFFWMSPIEKTFFCKSKAQNVIQKREA